MEAVKLFDKQDVPLDWDYDGEADTLYVSLGKPKPALGVDVGEGVIVRDEEKAREVVGLTLIDVGKRMEEFIGKNSYRAEWADSFGTPGRVTDLAPMSF